MRRILIIANTYYQLLLAIQLKNTIYKKDKLNLIVSNHSRNAKIVYERLKECNLFESVSYIESREIVYKKKTLFDKVKILLDNLASKNSKYSFYLREIDDYFFDEMIVYNCGVDIYGIFSILVKHNPGLVVSIMEEGILSYGIDIDNKNIKTIDYFRKAIKQVTLTETMRFFYCFCPEFYKGKLKPVFIPRITINSDTAYITSHIFDLHNNTFEYKQKYIFFTSVYDFEGGEPIGEYNLVCDIANIVGIDNLLIKTHPRDTRDIYEKAGFCVDKNSQIPWEAIQLSCDLSDRIYLTATSGSVLAGTFLVYSPIKTFYMYKLCKLSHNLSAQSTVKEIKRLLNSIECEEKNYKIREISRIEEILF